MDITIQQATGADAENIAVLSRQTFYDTFAAFNSQADMDKFMNESFSMQALADEVSDDQNIFLVAFMDDDLVGYAKLTESKNPPELGTAASIEIGRIYAAKKTIGLGVGKMLMQKCIQIASEKNKQLIWLGVWEHNERAKTFYTKFGFEKFGEHDFILGNDVQTDWLMKKPV
ncbi:MAG: GNAT family N-acetyltransferase [Bacteroidota bacterium]